MHPENYLNGSNPKLHRHLNRVIPSVIF